MSEGDDAHTGWRQSLTGVAEAEPKPADSESPTHPITAQIDRSVHRLRDLDDCVRFGDLAVEQQKRALKQLADRALTVADIIEHSREFTFIRAPVIRELA